MYLPRTFSFQFFTSYNSFSFKAISFKSSFLIVIADKFIYYLILFDFAYIIYIKKQLIGGLLVNLSYVIQNKDLFFNVKEVLKVKFEVSDRLLLKLKKNDKIFLNDSICSVNEKVKKRR